MPQLPRTKHRTADRQAELVQAALQLAAQHSPAEVTTAALAQAIGITRGVQALREQGSHLAGSAGLRAGRPCCSARRTPPHPMWSKAMRSRRCAQCSWRTLPSPRRTPACHAWSSRNCGTRALPLKDKVQQLMQRYRQLLTGLLEPCAAPDGPAPGLDVPAATVLFIGAVQGLVMQSLISGTPRHGRASPRGLRPLRSRPAGQADHSAKEFP